MTDTSKRDALLLEICRCPLVADALADPAHPCHEVVAAGQRDRGINEVRQVPEPWNGHLESAPILFVSSNPSISWKEQYPTRVWADASSDWSDEDLMDFFEGRFDATPARPPWIRRGISTRLVDDTYSPWVRFLAAVRSRAAELLDLPKDRVVPGSDYCLTEVTHCKSVRERGAGAAASTCGARYLDRVLRLSPAPVIVTLGKIAANALLNHAAGVEVRPADGTVLSADISGTPRLVLFLPHPAARGPAKTLAIVSEADRAALRHALAAHRRGEQS